MRRRSLVPLVVLALLLPSAAAWAEVKVFFSPQGGCDRALGEVCRVANPWPGRRFAAVTSSGVEAARSWKLGTHLCFPTCRGEEYELRPV